MVPTNPVSGDWTVQADLSPENQLQTAIARTLDCQCRCRIRSTAERTVQMQAADKVHRLAAYRERCCRSARHRQTLRVLNRDNIEANGQCAVETLAKAVKVLIRGFTADHTEPCVVRTRRTKFPTGTGPTGDQLQAVGRVETQPAGCRDGRTPSVPGCPFPTKAWTGKCAWVKPRWSTPPPR